MQQSLYAKEKLKLIKGKKSKVEDTSSFFMNHE